MNELRKNPRCMCSKKTQGAFGKNAGPLESVFACVRVHTLVRSRAFPGETNALHIGVRTAFIQVFAWAVIFFFLQKNLLVHNGVQNGVQNRVQIRGPKGGQLFCQHPQNTCNLYANVPIKSIYLSVCLSVCLSILSFTEIQIVCTSIYDFVQQLLCFVFIPAYIRIK